MTLRFSDIDVSAVYGGIGAGNALNNFLIPALGVAKTYDRVAGYFSSQVFANLAPGLAPFVLKGGSIKLVTSHVLTKSDFEALTEFASNETHSEIFEEFQRAVSDESTLEGKFQSKCVQAMCWLLKSGQLEVRIVVPRNTLSDSNYRTDFEKFHPKFGILTDFFGDRIAFSGSINETRLAWAYNLENVSTYKSWIPPMADYCQIYENQFADYWNGILEEGWETILLPDAIKSKLIQLAPEGDFPDLPAQSPEVNSDVPSRRPRGYQVEAVEAWESNEMIGLLEMATGTGKTFTAKQCILRARSKGSLLTVVVAPYQHIADQWLNELLEFQAIRIGGNGSWREKLQELEYEVSLGLHGFLTLVVVKNTAASADFVRLTTKLSDDFENFLFVGDEVHWLGANSLRNSLNEKANFRLGLSATPDRYFDEVGTEELRAFFGGKSVYKFDLEQALNWPNGDGTNGVLVPYEYKPIFVALTEDEEDKYRDFSKRIAYKKSLKNKSKEDWDEIERLQNLRSDIAKQAKLKIPALNSLFTELGANLKQTLIYCATFDQMGQAMEVARLNGIETPSRITGEEGTSNNKKFGGKNEREFILQNFASNKLAVLFAIDCLDEGVDIPSAEMGIILASSGNPKEFVQRRGRLMRKSPLTGKSKAVIYDMVVLSRDGTDPESLRRVELGRVKEFGELALNREEISMIIAREEETQVG